MLQQSRIQHRKKPCNKNDEHAEKHGIWRTMSISSMTRTKPHGQKPNLMKKRDSDTLQHGELRSYRGCRLISEFVFRIWSVNFKDTFKTGEASFYMNPQECVWEIRYRIITKTILQEKVRIHCNITIWFINLFLCLKLWRYPQLKQRWTRNGKYWRKFRRGTWRKSEVRNRWSMKQGRLALQFILHH